MVAAWPQSLPPYRSVQSAAGENGKANSKRIYQSIVSLQGSINQSSEGERMGKKEGEARITPSEALCNCSLSAPPLEYQDEDEDEDDEGRNVRGGTDVKLASEVAAALARELESKVDFSGSNSVAAPPCSTARPLDEGGTSLEELILVDPIWAAMRAEARLEGIRTLVCNVISPPVFGMEKVCQLLEIQHKEIRELILAEKEPLLSSFLYASILSHSCFERALGFVLANRLQNPTLLASQLMDIFDDVMVHDTTIRCAIRSDVQAVKDRDPSCRSYSWALLYLKGYHSLQSYRVAHALWTRGQKVLALALQSRISEVFSVDIHPAAKIGRGVLLDHATGVVIGETAVVGNRVSMMQGVTLGGTGREVGDRHPKIGHGALIGASATILGNIRIGKCAVVTAGSVVLKDVPAHSIVAGIPAKVIGYVEGRDPSLTMEQDVSKQFFHQSVDGPIARRPSG